MGSISTSTNNSIPVVYSPAGQDACAYYRMWIPHLSIPHSDYYFTGWKPDGTPNDLDLNKMIGKQVVIVQRQSSIFNLKAIRLMKQVGLKVIYDLDDNLWNLPHGNPAKKAFEANQQGFVICARECDLLTVSTRGLKTAASVSLPNKEILIIPNAMDFKLFEDKQIERDDGFVVIGWGGSNTHTDDVKDVFDLMSGILDQCPNAVMEIVGSPPKKEITQEYEVLEILEREETVKDEKKMVPYGLSIVDIKTGKQEEIPWHSFGTPQTIRRGKMRLIGRPLKGSVMSRQVLIDSALAFHQRYRYKMWVPIREYHNRLASWAWDMSIAPLEDYRFNQSKSNIKMLEAAALKIPCLVSSVLPYQEFCALGGKDLEWLLCHNLKEWKSKLIELINEPEKRKFLGEKMYETSKKYYDIEVIKAHWNYAFQQVVQ